MCSALEGVILGDAAKIKPERAAEAYRTIGTKLDVAPIGVQIGRVASGGGRIPDATSDGAIVMEKHPSDASDISSAQARTSKVWDGTLTGDSSFGFVFGRIFELGRRPPFPWPLRAYHHNAT
jgi:hypothetical protein